MSTTEDLEALKAKAREAGAAWADALMELYSGGAKETTEATKDEVRQVLLDALDVTEQSDLMMEILRAIDALDGKPTGAQEPFRDGVQRTRSNLLEAVTVFLRQHMRPDEASRVFPITAVENLQKALAAARLPELFPEDR